MKRPLHGGYSELSLLGSECMLSVCIDVCSLWSVACCCSFDKSCLTLWSHGLQHTKLPCLSLSPRVCSNSRPLSQWCYLITSSSASLFSFCLQSFPASGSFPMRWFFTSGGQSIGASASASVLPMNIQGWFLLGFTGLISLQPSGLSRVFSSTKIQMHQSFGAQPSLWSNSHRCIYDYWKNRSFDYTDLCW